MERNKEQKKHLPSARLPRKTSPGYPWMARTLSRCTPWRYGMIAFVSATNEATKFVGPHKSRMR
jgi:hypothetical protein